MDTRDGYRSKASVRKDSPVMVSYRSPPWFGYRPRLKVSRLGLVFRFEPYLPRLFSKVLFRERPSTESVASLSGRSEPQSVRYQMFGFGTRFETAIPIEMATRDGYRWKASVRKDSPVFVSCPLPPWFGHDLRLKIPDSVRTGTWEWVRVSIDAVFCVQCTALSGGRVRILREDLSPLRNIRLLTKNI
ncbi:hypothetical protein AVEN_81564-1 [Araneus ventricosus]|uniref:Uncharacterized protein n=1 Tax=Araneus ventricosus TaxID=182803 RepID=A0A4Y2PD01_ARAVE|nr:hypothetical protein AVEN_81564-1 [Araneus ventricosus]